MEQQAKERLTGGVILVVLLVLLVPELLTGPHPVLPPLPAQPDQAPLRSYTMDLGESLRANRGPVAASTTAPAAAPVTASSAPVHDTPAPAAATAPPQTPTIAAPRPAPPSAAPPHAGAWTVQLGTFSSRVNAARLVSGLKSHGFSAAISEATKNGRTLYRVRIGTERDRAAAQKLQGRLRAAGEKGGEIVPR